MSLFHDGQIFYFSSMNTEHTKSMNLFHLSLLHFSSVPIDIQYASVFPMSLNQKFSLVSWLYQEPFAEVARYASVNQDVTQIVIIDSTV